jgi:ATP adenylyltransferase
MDFDQLKTFIEKSMRMSHIYQPVMLMTLLGNGGKASVRGIATSILVHDESQIEYNEQITKEMVGRVLRNRRVVKKEGKEFELLDFGSLTTEQVSELIGMCQKKLDEVLPAFLWVNLGLKRLAEGERADAGYRIVPADLGT